jgi:hypothetical protein
MTVRVALLTDDDVSMFQGSTTLYRENLKSCAKEGGSTIPSIWSSNDIRSEMEAKGWLTSEPRANGFSTHWRITESGRAALLGDQR